MNDSDVRIIQNKMDKITELLETITKQQEDVNDFKKATIEDGEVTFKFSVNDRMVAVLPNLNTIMSKLEDLQNYRRELYKYDVQGEIYYNKETKNVKELDNMSLSDPLGEGYTTYIPVSKVIDKLDDILDGIYSLLEKYWY